MKIKTNITVSSVWKNFINIKHGLREIDSLLCPCKGKRLHLFTAH